MIFAVKGSAKSATVFNISWNAFAPSIALIGPSGASLAFFNALYELYILVEVLIICFTLSTPPSSSNNSTSSSTIFCNFWDIVKNEFAVSAAFPTSTLPSSSTTWISFLIRLLYSFMRDNTCLIFSVFVFAILVSSMYVFLNLLFVNLHLSNWQKVIIVYFFRLVYQYLKYL